MYMDNSDVAGLAIVFSLIGSLISGVVVASCVDERSTRITLDSTVSCTERNQGQVVNTVSASQGPSSSKEEWVCSQGRWHKFQ
jgi:hypothetical protein